MAKVKSGGIRNLVGRVGGNVYYMNKGQNIARELAPAISNPQTAAQQEQRMRWANLVSVYRANQPWQKRGAFESKKQTWSDYNAFVSANSKVSPVYLTKQQAEQGGAVVAPYIVTKGSLPSVALFSWEGQDVFCSDLYVGDLTITGATTAAELSAALRENNNGLQEGDQVSFILNIQNTNPDGVPFITARYYEFIIDSSDSRTLADIGLEGVILDDTYEDMQRLCFAHDGAVCGGAIIISRSTSGNIKVSTQSLVLTPSMQAYLADYTNDTALQRAARSYGENDPNFLAAGYSGKATNVAVPVVGSILGARYGSEGNFVAAGSTFAFQDFDSTLDVQMSDNVQIETGTTGSVTLYGNFTEGGQIVDSGTATAGVQVSSVADNIVTLAWTSPTQNDFQPTKIVGISFAGYNVQFAQ